LSGRRFFICAASFPLYRQIEPYRGFRYVKKKQGTGLAEIASDSYGSQVWNFNSAPHEGFYQIE